MPPCSYKRYQVCLFCYERLQKEFNGACPGCRTQYGTEHDAFSQQEERSNQQQQQEQHAASEPLHDRPSARTTAQTAAASSSTHQQTSPSIKAAAMRRPGESSHSRSSSSSLPSETQQILPAGTTWGSNQMLRQASSESEQSIPTTSDESAWPSLATAASGPVSNARSETLRRQSSSSSLSSLQSYNQSQMHHGLPKHSGTPQPQQAIQPTLRPHAAQQQQQQPGQHMLQQQQQQQPPQQQLQQQPQRHPIFSAVEVTSMVAGVRKSVAVPISTNKEIMPHPEAAALLSVMQQAVRDGSVNSADAAVQLVQLLRNLQVDNNRQPGSPIAARAAGYRPRPPGFGAAPGPAMQHGQQHHHMQQLSLHASATAVGPGHSSLADRASSGIGQMPVTRQIHRPISPPFASHSSLRSVDSSSSLFSPTDSSMSQSVWTDSGLPGLDFSAAAGAVSLPGIPPSLQLLWGGANGTTMAAPAAPGSVFGTGMATGHGGVTVPPPGFGHGYGGVASSSSGSNASGPVRNGYRPGLSNNPAVKQGQSDGLLSHHTSLQAPPGFQILGNPRHTSSDVAGTKGTVGPQQPQHGSHRLQLQQQDDGASQQSSGLYRHW
eukprot:jgi/Chrzof1/14774/Cz09g15200.t1